MSNHFSITGNLGRDGISLRFTPTGQAVANLSVADTPRKFNKDTNQWEDAGETLWVEATVWGEEAEALAERAGDYRGRVTVTGRLGVRTYEAKDGTNRTQVTVRADSVALHAPKRADRKQEPVRWSEPAPGDPWAAPQGGGDDAPPF